MGSGDACPRVAAIVSIVETCRRLKIPLRDYLGSVLPGLSDFPINRIAELTPVAWATRN
jgi:transposase